MGYSYKKPDNFDRGNAFIEKKGTYHFVIDRVEQNPVLKGKSEIMAGFVIHVTAVAGTDETQLKRIAALKFYDPNLSHKDGGEFAGRKIGIFFDATGLVDRHTDSADLDLAKLQGRQFIGILENKKDENTKAETRFVDLRKCETYHVDDPAMASIPKSAEHLKLLPASMRRQAAYFKTEDPPATGGGGQVNPDDLGDL